ncbi:DNA repair protein REV1, partial [Bienertia sinuspersici]
MAVKNKKLQDQFDAEASNSSCNGSDSAKPIFQGVAIFVDGFTIPSSQYSTSLFCQMWFNCLCLWCRSFSRGLPVVKPTWVLDCVAAKKLLSCGSSALPSLSFGLCTTMPYEIILNNKYLVIPVNQRIIKTEGELEKDKKANKEEYFAMTLIRVPYQLDQLASEASNQPKLSTFFSLKRNSISLSVSSDSTCMLKAEAEGSEVKDDVLLDHVSSALNALSESSRQSDKETEDDRSRHINSTNTIEQSLGDEESSPLEIGKLVTSRDEVEACRPSASTSSHGSYQKPAGESSGLVGRQSCQRHSTIEDPNFVENYFKSSRLHFIGTWRNRYRKRFGCLSNKIKQTNSGVSMAATSRKAIIIHMDMDCFFVAVVIRNLPGLMDKPVAVCHSDSPRGTAEISSANYPARDYGVKAGMFVRDAKAHCPHLVIVPYNFEAYEEVLLCIISTFIATPLPYLPKQKNKRENSTTELLLHGFEWYGASVVEAGIAANMLMARLATRIAKPDGQCHIPLEKVDKYLLDLPIKSLPGIGHILEQKLKAKGVQTCGQLRIFSKEALQRDFGTKTGEMLWNYCRGVDNRLVGVTQETKSVGADVNWGVRFKDSKDSEHFLSSLCKEVSLRLQGCGLQGRTFTLKIKKRRKDAKEPTKYMGCGDCENLSHSTTVCVDKSVSFCSLSVLVITGVPLQLQIPVATDDVDVLQRIAMQLFGSFQIDVKDIRGIGLQVTKLESDDHMKQGHERNSLKSWLASGTMSSSEPCNLRDTGIMYLASRTRSRGTVIGQPIEPDGSSMMISNPSSHETSSNTVAVLPSLEDLDLGVIKSLPPELFSEINDVYGGKLTALISKSKGKAVFQSGSAVSVQEVEGNDYQSIWESGCIRNFISILSNFNDDRIVEGYLSIRWRVVVHSWAKGRNATSLGAGCSKNQERESLPASGAATATISNPVVQSEIGDLIPSSLSQVDMSILQQLPEELRADIVGALPAHRRSNCFPVSCDISGEPQEVRPAGDRTGFTECTNDYDLWVGNPPCWVHKFKASNCLLLNILVEMFLRSGSSGLLSSTLQCCLSEFRTFNDATDDVDNEASYTLCELLKQYIDFKLEADIEEIYVCFRILKRLTSKSKAFKYVYDTVSPYLQFFPSMGVENLLFLEYYAPYWGNALKFSEVPELLSVCQLTFCFSSSSLIEDFDEGMAM